MTLPLCRQHTFQPTMRTESGSCTLPPPAPCPRHLPCLQNKVRVTHSSRRHGGSWLLMVVFILVQIVGLAAPCPGLPPLTAASWPHRCRLHPPTRWDDSSTLPPLSHRVSMHAYTPLTWHVLIVFCASTALNEELKMKLEKRRASQEWTVHWGNDPPFTAHSVFSDRPRLTGAIYPSCAFYINKNGLQIERSMKFLHVNNVMIKLCIRSLPALVRIVTDSCFIYQKRTRARFSLESR